MTAAEKRERRRARHQMQAKFQTIVSHSSRLGMFARPGQLKAAARVLSDRYDKEVVLPAAKLIEDRVVEEAKRRKEADERKPVDVHRLWRSDGYNQSAISQNTVREVLGTLS